MYAFIDTSGDMNSKEEQYVVTTAAVIRKAKIPSLLSQIYNLKKGILENERQEIKAQSFINASTLAQNGEPFSKKYTFIDRYVHEVLREFTFFAFSAKNTVLGLKTFESGGGYLPKHYKLLLERINYLAKSEKKQALILIDYSYKNTDRNMAFAFSDYLYKSLKGSSLGNIIEFPLFVDSEMTEGIQAAYVGAGILRNYYTLLEKQSGLDDKKLLFKSKVQEYYEIIRGCSRDFRNNGKTIYGLYKVRNDV